jgi:hypothetical protein
MTYVPTEWRTGDIVTADKLNHAEQGIADAHSGGGGGVYVVSADNTTMTLDKKWLEIENAFKAGKNVLFHAYADPSGQGILIIEGYSFVYQVSKKDDVSSGPHDYYVKMHSPTPHNWTNPGANDDWIALTHSPDGYPVITTAYIPE